MEAKFQIQELLGIGMTLIVLVIGLAYGLEVTSDVQDGMTVDSAQYNATGSGMEAVAKIPTKLPMIVTVIVASVVIGILVTYLYKSFA